MKHWKNYLALLGISIVASYFLWHIFLPPLGIKREMIRVRTRYEVLHGGYDPDREYPDTVLTPPILKELPEEVSRSYTIAVNNATAWYRVYLAQRRRTAINSAIGLVLCLLVGRKLGDSGHNRVAGSL